MTIVSKKKGTSLRQYSSELEGEYPGADERRTTKSLEDPRMPSDNATSSTDQGR